MLAAVTKVLIAERHQATRAGIRVALERAGHRVCAECEDAASAVEATERKRPDVCIVDLDLPGGGISAVRAIASRRRPPRVLVLAGRLREADFFAALRAGAQGFLIKDVDPSRLPAEVSSVAAGGAAIGGELTARLIEEFRRQAMCAGPPGGQGLSAREREVLGLLAEEDLTTKEIAARLHISPTTVRRHIAAAVAKLGAADRRAAVEIARADRKEGSQ